jgi:aquaporin Z
MLIDKFFAEMFGTFVFLAVIITTVESHNLYKSSQGWLKIGLALSICILAFGFVSGGHFNFGVSLMFYLNNNLSLEELGVYTSGQIIGSILAFLYYRYTKSYLD